MAFLTTGIIALLLSLISFSAVAAPLLPGMLWQSNAISHLHGANYEVGSEERDIVTIEHTSGWNYGDLFIFADFTDPDKSDNQTYAEIHPRISCSKVTGKTCGVGILKDILLAGEVEVGSGDHRAWLYGIGADFDLPGFSYALLNIYARDQRGLSGTTYQISPAWAVPFSVGKFHFKFEGFADIDGGEDTREASVLFVPQFTLDIGAFFGKKDMLTAGVEWQYWNNKFGIDGVDESVMQTLIKLTF